MKKTCMRIAGRVFAAALVFAVLSVLAAVPGAAGGALPSSYMTGEKTPVLDQKSNPLCWAYSGADLLSISAIKRGYAENGESVFSAPAVARAEYDGNEHRDARGRAWYSCSGDLEYVMMGGAAGKGLLRESDYPTVEAVDAAPVSALYDSVGYVSEYRVYDREFGSREDMIATVKKWVMEFGAVSANAFIGEYDAKSGVAGTLAYDNSKVSHSILIVGWDDNLTTPSGKGAFRIKNSWGAGWGDGGYAWISYGTEFGRTLSAAGVRMNENVSVLSHSETPCLSANGASASGPVYAAVNVFEADREMTVSEAGFYTGAKNTECRIYVWLNPGGVENALARLPDAAAHGSFDDAGYYLLELDAPLDAAEGDVLVVETILISGGQYRVYSEYCDPDFEMCVNSSRPGESYTVSEDGISVPRGNYLGTLIGHVADAADVTGGGGASADTETDAAGTDTPADTAGSAPAPQSAGAQNESTGGTGGTSETAAAGAGEGGEDILEAAGKLLRKILIAAAVVAAAVFVFMFAAVAASKRDKK